MTASNYDRALTLVLKHEGGYVNHPADPGGATNKGITQAVYNDYRRRKGRMTQSVRSITDAEVADIYRRQYAEAVRFDDLPGGVDYAVFDYAVNSGVSRASKELQRVVGADVDGHIGERTLAACLRLTPGTIINGLCDRRMKFLRGLKTWRTFGKGWSRRVAGVRAEAKLMAGVMPTPPVADHETPPTIPTPKAPQSKHSIWFVLVNLVLALFKSK